MVRVLRVLLFAAALSGVVYAQNNSVFFPSTGGGADFETSAELAALISDETGSGVAVFGTSPTIVTPTIASFANAAHDHTNAAGGGQLAVAALSDISTTYCALSGCTLTGALTETASGTTVFQAAQTGDLLIQWPATSTGRRAFKFESVSNAFALRRWSDNFGAATSTIWRVNNSIATDTFEVTAGAFNMSTGTSFSWAADTFQSREGAAILQLGLDVNGSPVPQTLKAHDGITGTNIAGAHLTIASGRGTGDGAISTVLIQTPALVGSGTTAQSLTTRVTIDSSGIMATGYKSSDGSAGVTAATCSSFKNGLCVAS